jgi:putative glycosyltransferase (TIGR04372 family)
MPPRDRDRTVAYARELAALFRKAEDHLPRVVLGLLDAADPEAFARQCRNCDLVGRHMAKRGYYNLAVVETDLPVEHKARIDASAGIHGCVEIGGPLPLAWLDIGSDSARSQPDWWSKRGFGRPDIVLPPRQLETLAPEDVLRDEDGASLLLSAAPPPRPTRIAAFVGHKTLGDCIHMNMTAAAAADRFGVADLAILLGNDRPYKEFLARCNPRATEIRYVAAGATLAEDGIRNADIFLSPFALDQDAGILLDPIPRFRIPPAEALALGREAERSGIDPRAWIVPFHVREGNYAYRRGQSDGNRDADPRTYLPMIRDILDRGGCVVRLGDPAATPLPALPGLIDLTRAPFPLQAYCVARARYLIASDSGPSLLGTMFGVPTAKANALQKGVGPAPDIFLPKWIRHPDGTRLDPAILEDLGAWHPRFSGILDPYVLENNSADDLVAASRHLMSRTEARPGGEIGAGDAGCPDWIPTPSGFRRSPPRRTGSEAGPGLVLPLRRDFRKRKEVWTPGR